MTYPAGVRALLALLALAPAVAHAAPPSRGPGGPAADAAAGRRLSLFVAGQIQGRLADVDCREHRDAAGGLHFARQVGAYRSMVESGRDPIAINVGDSAFPGPIPRFLLRERDRSPDLAEILARIPWTVHALGKRELAIERGELGRLAGQARRAGLALRAANLRCAPARRQDGFCEALETWRTPHPFTIAERSGLRIGIVSILDPETRSFMAEDRRTGLSIAEPAPVVAKLVRRLRSHHRVDLVMVTYHTLGTGGARRAHALAGRVSGIDVLLTNEALTAHPHAYRGPAGGFAVVRGTGTYVVSADTGHEAITAVDIRVSYRRGLGGWRIDELAPVTNETTGVPPDPATASDLRAARRQLCATWGVPIQRRVTFPEPLSMAAFQDLVLDIMRYATRSELAVVNRSAFGHASQFPLTGTLTVADVNTVLAYSNRIAVVELTGAELAKLAARIGDEFATAGLATSGDAVTVNGRPLQDSRTYRVATREFVATGGEDLFEGITAANVALHHPSGARSPPPLARVVTEFVADLRFPVRGWQTRALAPGRLFPDLHDRFLWTYNAAATASYNQVTVVNPDRGGAPAYAQPPLAVTPTNQLSLELRAGAEADSRLHGWGSDGLLQYGLSRTETEGEQGEFLETADLLRVRSQYRYNGFRAALKGRWYAPIPFVEAQLESELTPPDDRSWHKVELTGILGPELQLAGPLTVKLGVDFRRDVAAPEGEIAHGLFAAYRLKKWPVLARWGQKTEFESELEYFLHAISGGEIEHELRTTNRLYVTILGRLSFTTTVSAFLLRRSSVGELGLSSSVTIGLNYGWDAAVQSF